MPGYDEDKLLPSWWIMSIAIILRSSLLVLRRNHVHCWLVIVLIVPWALSRFNSQIDHEVEALECMYISVAMAILYINVLIKLCWSRKDAGWKLQNSSRPALAPFVWDALWRALTLDQISSLYSKVFLY